MKIFTKFLVIFSGTMIGMILAELSYYPAKQAMRKRHYITLRP